MEAVETFKSFNTVIKTKEENVKVYKTKTRKKASSIRYNHTKKNKDFEKCIKNERRAKYLNR